MKSLEELKQRILTCNMNVTRSCYGNWQPNWIEMFSGNKEVERYLEVKDELFLDEFKILLEELGIDIDKENDIVHYSTEECSIIEVKYDFIGGVSNEDDKSPLVYERMNYTVNIHLNSNITGQIPCFNGYDSSRIEITLLKNLNT